MGKRKETTQCDRVLDYMKKNKGISSLDAYREFGATRLSAIIYKLKDMGYSIGGDFVSTTNRYGDVVRFKRYYLLKKEPLSLWERIRNFM